GGGGEGGGGGQGERGPRVDRVAQPALGDGVEPRRAPPAAGGNTQARGMPVVTGVLPIKRSSMAASQHLTRSCRGRGRAGCGAHRAVPVSPHTPARVSASRTSAACRWM